MSKVTCSLHVLSALHKFGYPYITVVVVPWRKIHGQCISVIAIIFSITACSVTLHWRHNDHDGVSNHQPHGCLLNRLFRLRSKKISKLRVTGLCVGNSPGPVNSPHKGPVTRKMFPFDDVIMIHGSFCSLARGAASHMLVGHVPD